MCSRSQTGGGPPSVSDVGFKETADGESGTGRRGYDGGVGPGGATFEQPGVDGVKEKVVAPACLRNAAMPSGRRKGPEKSSRTVLEDKAGLGGPGGAV
eukprot:2141858-Pleurochrysis_carterae.AAC.1